jgi:hypothetical protein
MNTALTITIVILIFTNVWVYKRERRNARRAWDGLRIRTTRYYNKLKITEQATNELLKEKQIQIQNIELAIRNNEPKHFLIALCQTNWREAARRYNNEN